jgi:hypothetical protein
MGGSAPGDPFPDGVRLVLGGVPAASVVSDPGQLVRRRITCGALSQARGEAWSMAINMTGGTRSLDGGASGLGSRRHCWLHGLRILGLSLLLRCSHETPF